MKPFSYFIDGDRKPELVEIYKEEYLINSFFLQVK